VSRPDLIGTTLAGRYKIIGLIGEGGMGSVYLGEQIAMRRRTAIKVLHSGADDPDAIARFRRGSRNAARIDHPNVCSIFEYGDPPGGLHFLAMEYIEGKSLHDAISASPRGRVPLDRAASIFRQVVAALGAAHELGIIHRDLKPGNIMLKAMPSGEELVKVVDFDIAKAPSDPGDPEITELHWWVGTPVYMSPEQLLHQPLDPRSDIYSLGIVLYRTITGTLPFSATNQWAIMAQRLSSEPMPLGETAPDLSFPAALQRVLDRALRKDPEERWSTVKEFGDALERALAPGRPAPDISSAPTQQWKGDPGSPPPVVPLSPTSHEQPPAVVERTAAADVPDQVDPQIPATELAPPRPAPTKGGEAPEDRKRGRAQRAEGHSRRARTVAAAATLAMLVAGAWGATLLLGDRSPPVIGSDPEGQLSELQQRLVALDLAGSPPPPALAESADTVARVVFDRHPESPELQARAASVASQAKGYLGDWPGALDWGSRAIELAPMDEAYRATFAHAARERLLGLDRALSSASDDEVAVSSQEADSVARLVFGLSQELPSLQALAASLRASAQARLGNDAEAARWAQQAVDLAPGDSTYRAALATYGAPTNPVGEPPRREAAVVVPERASGPGVSEQLAGFETELGIPGGGLSNERAREIEGAAALVFDQTSVSADVRAQAALVRARALRQLGDWANAAAWAQRGAGLDPRHRSTADSVYARSVRGFEQELNGLLADGVPDDLAAQAGDMARRIYADVDASSPVRASAADLSATALLLLDDREGAVEWVRRAMSLDPGNAYYPRRLQLLGDNRE